MSNNNIVSIRTVHLIEAKIRFGSIATTKELIAEFKSSGLPQTAYWPLHNQLPKKRKKILGLF